MKFDHMPDVEVMCLVALHLRPKGYFILFQVFLTLVTLSSK